MRTPPARRADRPRARVRGLGDLAAVVPYLLGFTPHESLTCLAVTDGRVGLVARLDLSDVLDPVVGRSAIATLVGAVARSGAPGLIALVTSAAEVDPGLVPTLARIAADADLDLLDVGWQHDGRCRSLLCDDPVCCPPEGVAVEPGCQAAATAAYAGVVALPDRAAVAAEFDRPDGVDPARLEPLLEAWESRAVQAIVAGHTARHMRSEVAAVLEAAAAADRSVPGVRAVAADPRLADDAVARLVVALSDISVRDAVWLAVDRREVHGQGLWLDLARRAPAPYDASPLFLLGWRCWRAGDGVRALLAAERAQASDATYSAARLLLDAIERCVDPRQMPSLADADRVGGTPAA